MRAVATPEADGRADLRRAALLTGLWVAVVAFLQWNAWAPDLSALYIAGHFWHQGDMALVYAAPPGFFGGPAAAWRPFIAAIAPPGETAFPFVYPPLWAALMAPVTALMNVTQFANLMTLVHAGLLGASVHLAGRLARPAALPLWGWTALGLAILSASSAGYTALSLNQPTIVTAFLTLLFLERLQAGRPETAGVALALAAALKLSPALFAVVLVADRQFRALAAFALAGVLLACASLALGGWEMHRAFLTLTEAIGQSSLLAVVNLSLKPALLALASTLGFVAADPTQPLIVFPAPPRWAGEVASLCLLATIAGALALLRGRRGERARLQLALVLAIAVPLFGPLGWAHYYIVPLLLMPGFLAGLPRGRALASAIGLLAVSFTPAIRFLDLLPWPTANFVWAACLVWLALLAQVLWQMRTPRRNV